MSEQIDNGKGFLKEKLGEYQVNPPDSVWNSIASQLGGRRRRGMIIITLSAAASIALAVTLGITLFGPKLPDETGIAELQEETSGMTGQDPMTTQDSGEDQVAVPDTGEDQVAAVEVLKDQMAESRPERKRETLEERVARTLEELAEDPTAELTEEISEEIAMIEERDQEIISRDETADEVADETEEGQAEEDAAREEGDAAEVEETTEPSPDVTPDPDVETPLDPGPDLLEEQQRDPRWMIGAALSPLYSFRDAEASAMAGAADYESGIMAYAGGVHVSYSPGSRLAIESGIFYNKMGISIDAPGIQLFNESFDFSPLGQESSQANVTTVTNSVGNIIARSGEVYVNQYKLNAVYATNAFTDNATNPLSTADAGIRQHLDYLELPFNLRYTLIDRVIELQLVGGMSTNFLINNYVTMETSAGTTDIGYLTNIRSVNYSGNAGLGMIYHIQEQFSLHLEPRFRYFLNSINDATLPSTRPYTLGIYTGLSYTF